MTNNLPMPAPIWLVTFMCINHYNTINLANHIPIMKTRSQGIVPVSH